MESLEATFARWNATKASAARHAFSENQPQALLARAADALERIASHPDLPQAALEIAVDTLAEIRNPVDGQPWEDQ